MSTLWLKKRLTISAAKEFEQSRQQRQSLQVFPTLKMTMWMMMMTTLTWKSIEKYYLILRRRCFVRPFLLPLIAVTLDDRMHFYSLVLGTVFMPFPLNLPFQCRQLKPSECPSISFVGTSVRVNVCQIKWQVSSRRGTEDCIDNWKHWKLRWWIFAKVPVDVFSSRSEVSLSITVFFVSPFFVYRRTNNFVRYFRLLVFITCSSIASTKTRLCLGASIVHYWL